MRDDDMASCVSIWSPSIIHGGFFNGIYHNRWALDVQPFMKKLPMPLKDR
jgi:hypothetical protein